MLIQYTIYVLDCTYNNPDMKLIFFGKRTMPKTVFWKQAIRIAEEVCWTKLLLVDSGEEHLDERSSYQSRPRFDVMAK
jgi:hypothetical protein